MMGREGQRWAWMQKRWQTGAQEVEKFPPGAFVLFGNEQLASFLDEWAVGEAVMVENGEETWSLGGPLHPTEDQLELKAMSITYPCPISM